MATKRKTRSDKGKKRKTYAGKPVKSVRERRPSKSSALGVRG